MGRAQVIPEFVNGFAAGAAQMTIAECETKLDEQGCERRVTLDPAFMDGWSVGRHAIRHAVANYLDERGMMQLGSQNIADFMK